MTSNDRVFELGETFSAWDSRFYSGVSDPFYDRAVTDMLRVMRVGFGERVLDAGCGTGGHAVRAARFGARPVAVDISETALAQARSQAERVGVATSITFGREDLRHLSFDDGSFRHVFSWGVVIHIREIETALRELTRVLQPGGTLGLWLTNQQALERTFERLLRFLVRRPKQLVRLPLGVGSEHPLFGEPLWTWMFDIHKLIGWLDSALDLKLLNRHIGELTTLHWMLPEWAQVSLLYANRGVYRANLPAQIGASNMLVFEKRA